jgi:hypothetical protein
MGTGDFARGIVIIGIKIMNVQMQKSFTTKIMLSGIFGMMPLISLEKICAELLDISYNTALRKARNFELPFPTVRLGESQKAKWFVNIDDLAKYIDSKSEEAKVKWEGAQI